MLKEIRSVPGATIARCAAKAIADVVKRESGQLYVALFDAGIDEWRLSKPSGWRESLSTHVPAS
jgi:hypothetical protein